MTEEPIQAEPVFNITDDDKLWAMLGYMPFIGAIVAILALIMEDKKTRPYIKFHAVQSLSLHVLNGIISGILSFVIIGVCTGILGILYMIFIGVKAYQGENVEVPFVTQFIKDQGWA
ncbi:MAG: DUF4870 domain-containing protein [Candidatus Scalindua sp.]|jgi:uncharacterized membrane protein|nr:DUF4870 domain-containing protein [Candidatus Scalindua sp.]